MGCSEDWFQILGNRGLVVRSGTHHSLPARITGSTLSSSAQGTLARKDNVPLVWSGGTRMLAAAVHRRAEEVRPWIHT
jgi:hypothetical protein